MLLPHAGSIAPAGLFNDPLARTDDHGLCHRNDRAVSIVVAVPAHRDLASSQLRLGRRPSHRGRCIDMAENITENIRV